MTQPAKGQELSMEEILASIRRIIADEPAKAPHNDSPRAEGLDRGRRIFQNPDRSSAASVTRIPQNDATERERDSPQPQFPLSHSSRAFPEPCSSAALGRPVTAPLSSPTPEHRMQEEEIEAFLAELGGDSAKSPETFAESTEQTPSTESLPEPEFTALDHALESTSEEEEHHREQEQSHAELDEDSVATQPRPTQLPPRAPLRDQRQQYAQRSYEPELDEDALISANTTAAVNSAFNTLAQTVLVQNGRTLEELVREMLRPMLKIWLDDNLPGMVERLVRAEIERVSRGRG